MADADVPITAGSGTKIDTRTVGAGTDEHRQVVVVGDPATAANVAAVSAAGAMKVDIASAPQVAVNNVETLTDNAAFTDGTSKVFPGGYVFDETAGTALTENDVAAARVNANRSVVTVTEDGVTRGRYATVKAASTAAAATDPAQVVSLSPNSPVPPPALTKGTQGAAGFSVQDLKDAGRAQVMLNWGEMAGTANVESALTNFSVGTRGGAAVTAAASLTVTAGKTLRIQEIHIYVKATSTVNNQANFRLRQAATVSNTSPIVWSAFLLHETATVAANMMHTKVYPIPDGLEVAGGQQIAFTWLTSANSCTVGLILTGYEY